MISIVVLTYNSQDFITSCLNSVFSQSCQNFEVIVVDNASGDNTLGLVKKYSKIVLIDNKENLGACKARNQGVEASNGEWVLTLDCDVVLEKDFVFKAIKRLNSALPSTGALQPKIFNNDYKTINSCGIYITWFRRFYDIGRRRSGSEFNESRNIFGACSACALYRKKMLQELKEESGYFDERFFFLVEDVDLAWRSQKKGWRTLFIPELNCYHRGNSSNTPDKLRQFLCFRNRYFSIIKNDGIIRYLLKILPLALYDIPRVAFLAITNPYIYYMQGGKPECRKA